MKIKIVCISFIVIFFSLLPFVAFADDVQSLVLSNSAFGFDLYQKLKVREGNLFFSPYSISTALAMAYTGASGQTKKEMAEVLHFSSGQKDLHASFSKLQYMLNTIQHDGKLKISIANSLWVQDGYPLLNDFTELIKKYYANGLNFVDFIKDHETARQTINNWIEYKTQHTITELIKPNMINEDTKVLLCNAIYFKGNWLTPFGNNSTNDSDFYLSSDKTIKVPMMNQKSSYKFINYSEFSAIELPYKGNALSMVVFLPKKIDGLVNFERNLTDDNVNHWIDILTRSRKSELVVSLPKFKTTIELKLSNILSEMGMHSAFSRRIANFSGMTGKKDFFIDEVIHKAFVEVNEEGTEAAAVTTVNMTFQSCYHPPPVAFCANHPFVFLIRENKSGSILFIGRMTNPTI